MSLISSSTSCVDLIVWALMLEGQKKDIWGACSASSPLIRSQHCKIVALAVASSPVHVGSSSPSKPRNTTRVQTRERNAIEVQSRAK